MAQNELYHYGVLGMKWGVRCYQNSDGTLTAEGRKRYNQDVKDSNKEAFDIGRQATEYGRATKYAADRAAKLEDRAMKKLQKDPDQLKKGTQKAVDNALSAERAAMKVAKQYSKLEKEAQKNVSDLMKKYGKENVKDINYKDVKLSKSAAEKMGKDSIRVVNEKVNNLSDWASTGLASLAISGAIAATMHVPVAFIMTPKGKNQRGAELASQYYINEWEKNFDKKNGYR